MRKKRRHVGMLARKAGVRQHGVAAKRAEHTTHVVVRYTMIPWRRFWCPLGATIHCGSEGGFLTDPEDEYGKYYNKNVVRLANAFPQIGPLVLCGEPGIGRSTELETIRKQLSGETKNCQRLIWLVFREISDLANFREKTVASATWKDWRADQSTMTLVVDGVDEGLLRVPNFVNDLTGILREEPCERLRLVLACRTAEWPIESGSSLLALWGKSDVPRIYELCPLCRVDAELAARANGCDPDKFIHAVWDRNVIGLAARPVTLFFLISEFRRHGGLSATHRELYERGTARLSREINATRAELLRSLGKVQTRVTDAERLRAAQRLAAMLLLSGRSAIRITTGFPETTAGNDLLIEDACDLDDQSQVTSAALHDALETALFTSLGERRFGFVHQTFAECLAAQHLRKLPLIQLRKLLCQRDARGEHVVPQLAELAAWVAGWNSDFLAHILQVEPEMLLRSDVTRIGSEFKANLVEALLGGAQREEIFDEQNFTRFLGGLEHAGLPAQLRPYIVDPSAGFIARRIAFEIAERCHLGELVDDVLGVVLNDNETDSIRSNAVSCLEDIIPDDRLALLEPLARGEVFHDPDDNIRGSALRRLVPQHWKVRDALPFLSHPHNDHFIGAYHMFLTWDLVKAIEDDDLPQLLQFMRTNPVSFDGLNPFHEIVSVGFARALTRLANPNIAAEVVNTWKVWVEKHEHHHIPHDSVVKNTLTSNDDIRRRFATLILNQGDTSSELVESLLWPTQILVDSADLEWLLGRLSTIKPERRARWIKAIGFLAGNPDYLTPCWDKLLNSVKEIPELAAAFEWFRAWEIDEPLARNAKAHWLRDKRRQKRFARLKAAHRESDAKEEIQKALARLRDGESKAWIPLCYHLSRDSSGSDTRILDPAVTSYPGWGVLPDHDRELCFAGARAYLLEHASGAAKYEPLSYGSLAGSAAVWLLRDAIDSDQELKRAVSLSWLRALIPHISDSSAAREKLFELAYHLNPEGTIGALLEEAKEDANKHQHLFAFRVGKTCWDARLSEAVVTFLDTLTDAKSIRSGIEELATHDSAAASEYIVKILEQFQIGSGCYPTNLLSALVCGLLIVPARVWSQAKLILEMDDALAKRVWQHVCYDIRLHKRSFLSELPEKDVADCYLMFRRLFPPESDPPRSKGFVSGDDTARETRGQIPSVLAGRGTEAARRELLRLSSLIPEEKTWLRWSYRQGLTNLRKMLWQPLASSEVVEILSNNRARLVCTEDDLLEVIVESLQRLQRRLTKEKLPRLEDLWQWDGAGNNRKNFRPKDEEAISDYVARWLYDDLGPSSGVVINREVQPRRGERTDVLVEASVPGTRSDSDTLGLVIEVKGCWHDEILNGLQTQLVDGYLRGHGWTHGIYLVGWFVCPQWQKGKNALRSKTIAEAQVEVKALAQTYDGKTNEMRIEALVLDCALTRTPSRSAGRNAKVRRRQIAIEAPKKASIKLTPN